MGGLPWWSSVLDFASIAGGRDWGTQIPCAVVWPKKKKKFFVCLLTLFIVIFGMLYIFVTVKCIHVFLRVSR